MSNETQGWDVFFDNLSIQYKQGPLLEMNNYYPFGLTMQGLSDKAVKTNYAENKYRYNQSTELQNEEFIDGTGLQLYETSYRGFDPQLGRFSQIDPMADRAQFSSAYSFAANNPVSAEDPTGLLKQDPQTMATMNYFTNRGQGGASDVDNSFEDADADAEFVNENVVMAEEYQPQSEGNIMLSGTAAQSFFGAFQSAVSNSDDAGNWNIMIDAGNFGNSFTQSFGISNNSAGSLTYQISTTFAGSIRSYGLGIGYYSGSIVYKSNTDYDGTSYFITKSDGSLSYSSDFTMFTNFISTPKEPGEWFLNYNGQNPTTPSVSMTEVEMSNNTSLEVGSISMYGTLFLTQTVDKVAFQWSPYVVFGINFTIYSNIQLCYENSVKVNPVGSSMLNFFTPP